MARPKDDLKALLKTTVREGNDLILAWEAAFEARKAGWKKTSPNRRLVEKAHRRRVAAARNAMDAATKAVLMI